jgi:preprotein translocase subunit SecG
MIFTIVLSLHVIVCVLLTIVVLMQSSRGSALSAAFGGSGGQLFGGREAATFLGKATTWLAIGFFVTSLALAFLSAGRGGGGESSALKRAAREQWGTVAPEDRKSVSDVMGNVPQPDGGQGQQSGAEQAPAGQGGNQP